MNSIQFEQEMKKLKNDYIESFNEKDNQSLFYFIQIIELLYSEVSYEVYDKEKLYDIICNVFKNNTNIVFSNMKDYYLKVSNNLVNEFMKLVKASAFNKYINSRNLSNIYNNFKAEVNLNMKLDNKIKVLSGANGNLLLEQIHTNCIVNDSKKVIAIVNKYVNSITEEMIKNVNGKNSILLNTYKNFIEIITEDTVVDKEKINNMNLKVIANTTYIYLKEQEYFVIENYINENTKAIDNFFDKVDNSGLAVKNDSNNMLNSLKDYLIGFNNTIRVKVKNIFDEMNLIVTLDNNAINSKMKEFTDLISHIYEIDIKFDKQFSNYKKHFNVPMRNHEKFDKMFNKECEELIKTLKLNITNIFRDNTKLYNDIVYKCILLKSRIDEFLDILSEDKVKDLLLK